ncbi:hypothetical protein F5Y07DRAFT_340681 [Xylaria sp. FL0933]|nr:hypothetical protein F5Y07DRAFT_340681 [Xylaria sp. FL0933]
MQFYKHLLTLGLGLLTVWGIPSTPASKHVSRDSENQPITDIIENRGVPATVKVSVWTGLGEGTNTHPTYVATLNTMFLGAPSHDDLGGYARKGFENMMTQRPRQKDTHLMAALYVPSAKSIYLSSVPDGPAIGKIKGTGAASAPAWWSQVEDRQPLVFHAEDSVSYRYESSLGTKLSPGDKYPDGSLIAVYGMVNGQSPRVVPLCAGGGDRPLNPPCSSVFRNLGVNF